MTPCQLSVFSSSCVAVCSASYNCHFTSAPVPSSTRARSGPRLCASGSSTAVRFRVQHVNCSANVPLVVHQQLNVAQETPYPVDVYTDALGEHQLLQAARTLLERQGHGHLPPEMGLAARNDIIAWALSALRRLRRCLPTFLPEPIGEGPEPCLRKPSPGIFFMRVARLFGVL